MKMDAGLDTGPMLRQRAIPIAADETGATLHDKLAALGGELLIETLADYLAGAITPQPQPATGVTIAPRITRAEGRIDWTQPAPVIERTIRAYIPFPSTYTYWEGKLLKLHAASVADHADAHQPGTVLLHANGTDAPRVAIATGHGLLLPQRVQLEGRAASSIDAFVRGYPTLIGAHLE
jgi:methionyl-tRNA formyltransferase